MERTEVLDMMGELKLYGMKSAYDEIMHRASSASTNRHSIVGDLLKAEIAEKQARSIKYQLTVAKLPLAKDLDDFPPAVSARGAGASEFPAAAFLAGRPERADIVRPVLSRRAVGIVVAPGIVRRRGGLEIGSVPARKARGLPNQRRQTLFGGRVAAGVEIEQVERAGDVLHLDLRGLTLDSRDSSSTRGPTRPTIMPMMASTTSISTREKPARGDAWRVRRAARVRRGRIRTARTNSLKSGGFGSGR